MSDVLSDSPVLLIMAFSLLGFANIFITFSSVHDAIHDAISPKRWVNRLLARGMDFVGASSYLLRQMHGEHHRWVNIHGIDVTLETHGLFRFTPHEPWKPIHRFQHIYIPFLYSMAQLQWITFKDFKWFFGENHIGNIKNVKHPLSEYIILFISKVTYYTLTLVLPLVFLSASWWLIVIGWVSIHILSGLTFALIFQCTHVYDGTTYPMPDGEGNIENNYALHVLNTTADFSRNNSIGSWLMGGINIHVMHHIFPNICHVHYQKITPILIKTAREFGIEYQEYNTFSEAFIAHFTMLKHLSRKNATVPEYNLQFPS
jgi:linoleoyl-CoA desaturase